MYVCMYVCVYVRTYVCMYVCGLRLVLLCYSILLTYEYSMFVAISRYYDRVCLTYSVLCGVSHVTEKWRSTAEMCMRVYHV
jgi:hypothetical protein